MNNEKTLVEQMVEFAERFEDKDGWPPAWHELNDVEFRRSLSTAMCRAGCGEIAADDRICEIQFHSGIAGFFDVMVERWYRGTGMVRVNIRITAKELAI